MPKEIEGKQDFAIKNAQKLIQYWQDFQGKTNPATDNPSTTIHNLVLILKSFKVN